MPGGESPVLVAAGTIAAFQPEYDRIESYLEGVELYLATNNFLPLR